MSEIFPYGEEDFSFTDLYIWSGKATEQIKTYPFSNLKQYFTKKSQYGISSLNDEYCKNFKEFQPIINRNDYFYYIAHTYFHSLGIYKYSAKKDLKILKVNKNGEIEMKSFFAEINNKIKIVYNESIVQFRHEYIICNDKSRYVNRLLLLIILDFEMLNDALRKDENVFTRFGYLIKEQYINFLEFLYTRFNDFISDDNFITVKAIIYPSEKVYRSFAFKKFLTPEARDVVIKSIYDKLSEYGYIHTSTKLEQIDDLFKNKRRTFTKIIWTENLTTLFTFVKIMLNNNLVEDCHNNHWKIVCDYFVLTNDSDFSVDEIKSKKLSTNFQVRTNIESCFATLEKIKVVV